jgi:hypothetical protein
MMKALPFLIGLWSCIDCAAIIAALINGKHSILFWAFLVQCLLIALAFKVFKE